MTFTKYTGEVFSGKVDTIGAASTPHVKNVCLLQAVQVAAYSPLTLNAPLRAAWYFVPHSLHTTLVIEYDIFTYLFDL
ncbi:hypothetical protein [Vibrio cholerae]|uniref:hypothetical protein n=1 Tax=Vibrio cholerae TaxID=666 RepID=UPI00308071DD